MIKDIKRKLEIIKLHNNGKSFGEIGKQYNISKAWVRDIYDIRDRIKACERENNLTNK